MIIKKPVLESPFDLLNRHVKVSYETVERLTVYHDLLIKWQSKINLISNTSIADAWHRHFLDSAQLLPYISLDKNIADIGSGAGFPGMVLAICGAKKMHLIESDARKISFLHEVARLTNTDIKILHKRVEDVKNLKADIILSRALSSLSQLLNYSTELVSHGTICLFHKGKKSDMELRDAKEKWSFDYNIIPSVTDNEGVILQLSQLERREA